MKRRPITIVGGGLSGLALGIGLRQRGIPVAVLEAGTYPRHRVCGEFISGKGQLVLQELGLVEHLKTAGAIPARTVRFFLTDKPGSTLRLPYPAISISRKNLDSCLAERFRELGGQLQLKTPWRVAELPESFVRTTGRTVEPLENGWRWFGLKAQVKDVELTADLEMHCSSNGYIGISRLADGIVNVCGLFRGGRQSLRSSHPPRQLLRGSPGSVLELRLRDRAFLDGSFCAVAGLPLKPRKASRRLECALGDALTMIPPVTGNGMSMAFEAAAFAIPPLTCYSHGQATWREACQRIAALCDEAFARRLFWAGRLHKLLFAAEPMRRFSQLFISNQLLWSRIFSLTR